MRRNYQVGRQLFQPTLTVRLANEDVRQFDQDGDELDEAATREAVGFAGIERPVAFGWDLAVGIEGRTWDEPDRANRSTLGAAARLRNRERAGWPRAGGNRDHCRACIGGGIRRRALSTARLGGSLGKRNRTRLPARWRRRVSGYHLGERRGDREAMVGFLFTVPVKGPACPARVGHGRNRRSRRRGSPEEGGLRACALARATPCGAGAVRVWMGAPGTERLVRPGRWF
jgi:hypothetical protein